MKENPEIPCRFRDFLVPLPSLTDSGIPLGRAHVRRSALSAGHFFMPRNQQEDVKGHRPEGALLTSGPNDNDGCHSED